MGGVILGIVVVFSFIIMISGLMNTTSNAVKNKKSARDYAKSLEKFGAWANHMNMKVVKTQWLWDSEKSQGDMLYFIWAEIEKQIEFASVNTYHLIDEECPKIKANIDELMRNDDYDADRVYLGLVAYSIASLWIVSDVKKKGVNEQKIKDLINHLKITTVESKKILKEIKQLHTGMKKLISNPEKHSVYDDIDAFHNQLAKTIAGIDKVGDEEMIAYTSEFCMTLKIFIGSLGSEMVKNISLTDDDLVAGGALRGISEDRCSLFSFFNK